MAAAAGGSSSSNNSCRSRGFRSLVALALLLSLLTCGWITIVLSSASAPQSFHEIHDEQEEYMGNPGQAATATLSSAALVGLDQVVFGIAGSAKLWPSRKELIRLWWRPGMRGHVWLEEAVDGWDEGLPPVRVSQDTSSFSYTNVDGHPAGIRISRIVQETFQVHNLTTDAHWFVLCDDDTILNVDNLLRLLATYDASQPHYIGGVSESHAQNIAFSHQMAFGGGGLALSFPLAAALARTQDACLPRYAGLAGSDDRLHACITELGVPLTIHPGFHQMDIYGSPMGLLSAHPVAPFVSMHHVETVDPVFPHRPRLSGLRLLAQAMRTEASNFLQQAIGYDHKRGLTFSVSTGYVVQIFPDIIYPAILQKVEITFRAWNFRASPMEFDMDTRMPRSACKQPALFFLDRTRATEDGKTVVTDYKRHAVDTSSNNKLCWSRPLLWKPILPDVQGVRVTTRPLGDSWFKAPRRQCCHVQGMQDEWLRLTVSPCEDVFTSSKTA